MLSDATNSVRPASQKEQGAGIWHYETDSSISQLNSRSDEQYNMKL